MCDGVGAYGSTATSSFSKPAVDASGTSRAASVDAVTRSILLRRPSAS